MARRALSSQSRSRAGCLPDMIGEYPLGRHTGLPLIMCDVCQQHRVIELVVQTDDNGNRGRVFFKCPRNNPGVAGRCTFFEFQRDYLYKLVAMKKVLLLPGEASVFEEEAISPAPAHQPAAHAPTDIDALVRVMTIMCVIMFVAMFVSVLNKFQ